MPRILSAVPLLVAFSLSLVIAAPATAAPKIGAQKNVKPGKKASVRLVGFPKRARIMVQLQPTAYRDGNGFGIAIKKRFRANGKGRGRIRFRMPRRYFACSSYDECRSVRWARSSRVDINVCTTNPKTATCARAVARIR